jgi:hypothetical protein
MTIDDKPFGYTLEDEDRKLESGGVKIYGQTCIPRGLYKVTISYSHHFNRDLPELLNVPGFTGVRIHGGNRPADTEGCILLGRNVGSDSCSINNCTERNITLLQMIQDAEERGEEVTLEVV